MRRVELLMGTHASVDIPNCDDEKVFNAVFDRFHEIIERFSPFKPSSELCRIQRSEIGEDEFSAEMKEVILSCLEAEKMTNGYFSAWFELAPVSHLDAAQGSSEERVSRTSGTVSKRQSVTDAALRQEPAGTAGSAGRQGQAVRGWRKVNPTGYVKGWAIAEAGRVIESHGYKTYCVSVGGDILARSDSKKTWNIGIQDPGDKTRILNKLSIPNGAVATSGSYERGGHVINPKTKKPNNELLSITVVGPDIIMADILATAGFAMGKKGVDFIKKQKDYDAIATIKP